MQLRQTIRASFSAALLLIPLSFYGQTWPAAQPEAKAGTRWWWMGSAVDDTNLKWNLEEYARAGIGAVEITPLYGVQNNEAKDIPYLSDQWMAALRTVESIAAENGIEVDMNNGTGWPFGGPTVPIEEAACKAIFIDTLIKAKKPALDKIVLEVPEKEKPYAQHLCTRLFATDTPDVWRVIAVYASRTRQKVKRAAPGGEGWVIDHFDRKAVDHYLSRFDDAFGRTGTPWPHTFFNDSYEVYGANWTPTLFDEFAKRRGYRLEDKLPELLGDVDDGGKVLSDYRETLSDLLFDNFMKSWVNWAHGHGVKIRNQAHGSPANLLDIYAMADIPEIEGFGLSDFGIKGLRVDPGFTRKNFSDVSMLKYAPSAAHVTGKLFTSSETFTWLTEHFRTSLSQMKPDLDLMFTCGVNHVYFHGTCYSPKDDPWPGWKFYASVDMSPTNSIWHDAPSLMEYIERSQRFLQWGQPDNDFLVYLPVRDMWNKRHKPGAEGLLMQFDIHAMEEKAPDFIKSILRIDELGYDCDYISDLQLSKVRIEGNRLVTEGGTKYKGLIIPTGANLPEETKKMVDRLSAYVVYGEDATSMQRLARPEAMKSKLRLREIRRRNESGYHYFIANLTPKDKDQYCDLAVGFEDAVWFDPMTGDIYPADILNGRVRITLRSGESRILQTYDHQLSTPLPEGSSYQDAMQIDLTQRPWQLSFSESHPAVEKTFQLDGLRSWEGLDDDSVKVTMGTGVYETDFKLKKKDLNLSWWIDLGDVRESARVYINGEYIGCAWAVPFTLDCKNHLRKGKNHLRIEVTNLPANRIADLDRRGVQWRKMKEINVVDINYKRTTYEGWSPVASGLNSQVVLIGKERID